MVVNSEYKGSCFLFCKHVFLYILVTAPVLSFCLMGIRWYYLFSTMLVLAIPLIVFFGMLISRAGKFSFDDEQQQIIKPFKRRIPYQSIMRIDINETGRLMQVSVKRGFLRGTPLSYALDSRDKQRLKEDLLKRFPQMVIREKRFVDWKSIGVILTAVVFLTAAFHLYLYRSNEALNVIPCQVTWKSSERPAKNTRQYSVGNFRVSLPGRFQLTGMDEGALQFEDRLNKTEIKFIAGARLVILGPKADFVEYASGIHDYYDVQKTAYFAQAGIVPLVLKDMILAGLSDVVLYEVFLTSPEPRIGTKNGIREPAQTSLKGFLLQGKKREQEIASLFLMDGERREQLQVFLSGKRNRLDEKRLQEITEGIYLQAGQQIFAPFQ
jgi:hypothetical protein